MELQLKNFTKSFLITIVSVILGTFTLVHFTEVLPNTPGIFTLRIMIVSTCYAFAIFFLYKLVVENG